jgi:hypothetical protein
MHLAALKGHIWDDIETLDPQEHHGLSDAFAAGAAKAMGITKRTGWPTRIIFVCEPNTMIYLHAAPPAASTATTKGE